MDTHTHLPGLLTRARTKRAPRKPLTKEEVEGPGRALLRCFKKARQLQGEPQGPTEDMAPHAEASETTFFLGILSGPFALQSLAAVHGLVA